MVAPLASISSYRWSTSGRWSERRFRARETLLKWDDETLVVQVEWCGGDDSIGAIGDVDRDFFALYGMLSEGTNFVQRELHDDAIWYTALLGYPDEHGHWVQVRLVGEAVRHVLEGHWHIVRANSGGADHETTRPPVPLERPAPGAG